MTYKDSMETREGEEKITPLSERCQGSFSLDSRFLMCLLRNSQNGDRDHRAEEE